ncbi:hypothetical protein [Streptomyces sp. NPDC017529]|uniref:hypothetical protein n=1 Tax=Streptomyces sp. NPDC017529 TaxID=3365000 RepID=UPI0037AF5D93
MALLIRFRGEGRILATAASRGRFVIFVVWTASVAGLASTLLVPYASNVPPAIVGAAAGIAVVFRTGQAKQPSDIVLKVLTLYNSVLLERLAEQVKSDEADWSLRLAEGFCESFELEGFIDDVKSYLLQRTEIPGRTKQRTSAMKRSITATHQQAQTAVRAWATQERNAQKLNSPASGDAISAERKVRNARARAEQHCCFLLGIAYKFGNRAADRKIEALKGKQSHHGVRHGLDSARSRRSSSAMPRVRPRFRRR